MLKLVFGTYSAEVKKKNCFWAKTTFGVSQVVYLDSSMFKILSKKFFLLFFVINDPFQPCSFSPQTASPAPWTPERLDTVWLMQVDRVSEGIRGDVELPEASDLPQIFDPAAADANGEENHADAM